MKPSPNPPKTLTFRYPLTFRVVETAKANGVNPWAYLKNMFTALPSATAVTQIDVLLPWHSAQGELSGR